MDKVREILNEIRDLGIVTVEELNSFFATKAIETTPEEELMLTSEIDSLST